MGPGRAMRTSEWEALSREGRRFYRTVGQEAVWVYRCVASLSRLADRGDDKPVSATEMAAMDAGLLLPSRPLARAC